MATLDSLYYAISDPTRRQLLDRLRERETTVNELASPFRMTRPAISHHLRILREAGLVKVTRAGRERHYRLSATRLKEIHAWLAQYERFWTDHLSALGDYLDRTP